MNKIAKHNCFYQTFLVGLKHFSIFLLLSACIGVSVHYRCNFSTCCLCYPWLRVDIQTTRFSILYFSSVFCFLVCQYTRNSLLLFFSLFLFVLFIFSSSSSFLLLVLIFESELEKSIFWFWMKIEDENKYKENDKTMKSFQFH